MNTNNKTEHTNPALTSSEAIAKLNDLCRTAPGIGGRWLLTHGIVSLPTYDQSSIRETVEKYDNFTEDNDPYNERDFGSFEYNDHTIFWKIDYYARDLIHGSEDPADPAQTIRILTIMLASEY